MPGEAGSDGELTHQDNDVNGLIQRARMKFGHEWRDPDLHHLQRATVEDLLIALSIGLGIDDNHLPDGIYKFIDAELIPLQGDRMANDAEKRRIICHMEDALQAWEEMDERGAERIGELEGALGDAIDTLRQVPGQDELIAALAEIKNDPNFADVTQANETATEDFSDVLDQLQESLGQ